MSEISRSPSGGSGGAEGAHARTREPAGAETCDAWNDRLSEYLDDELDPGEREALAAHLGACVVCRKDLDALREVTARAAALSDAGPGADLWSGIRDRIGASPPAVLPLRGRRFSFTLPQLIAAGLALMVLSGGMVWLARFGGERTDFPTTAAFAPPDLAPAHFADRAYDDAIADLRRTLDAGRSKLGAQTVRVLETNLQAIDQAIAQCREALAADPENVYLNTYLAHARGRKLELLRQATGLVEKSS
jgi:hypothetical protein